jgi:pyruvate dehydrogenase E1 component alpha subunit
VEAYTYRMGAHTTSDDPTRYRLHDDLEHWKLKDPIARVKAYLARGGGADESYFAAVEAESDQVALRLRELCLSMPDPDVLDIFDQVYADKTPELARQQQEYAAYLATFEDGDTGSGPGSGSGSTSDAQTDREGAPA